MNEIVNKNIHYCNRKEMIKKAGFNVSSLAAEINYTRQAVNEAIIGISRSYRCHAVIAAKLNKSLAELWPDIYCVTPDTTDVKKVSHG